MKFMKCRKDNNFVIEVFKRFNIMTQNTYHDRSYFLMLLFVNTNDFIALSFAVNNLLSIQLIEVLISWGTALIITKSFNIMAQGTNQDRGIYTCY